ncbi:hypothetical protein CRENBAI_025416 [Crenichthys baileyi]|uniref:Uncharacterized protein n=1 Tax=Crenichthys baileyi TaxID=28760 RepID=A0AAV9SR43_9TELE
MDASPNLHTCSSLPASQNKTKDCFKAPAPSLNSCVDVEEGRSNKILSAGCSSCCHGHVLPREAQNKSRGVASFVSVSANDTESHGKQHGGLIFVPSRSKSPNFTTTHANVPESTL